jgi:hypothetical protein
VNGSSESALPSGTETGTAGTASFCLSGTGTVMHSGTGSGTGSNNKDKMLYKSKNQKFEAK